MSQSERPKNRFLLEKISINYFYGGAAAGGQHLTRSHGSNPAAHVAASGADERFVVLRHPRHPGRHWPRHLSPGRPHPLGKITKKITISFFPRK